MTKKVNKSKAVRDYLKAHLNATSGEISATLARRGIVVAANVASVIKSKSKARWRAVNTVMNEVAGSRGVGLLETRFALSFLALTGGVEKANRALTAAKKVVASRGVCGPEVRFALSFLALAGGVEGAKVALAAAQEIRAMV
jgi:hypothetical protein